MSRVHQETNDPERDTVLMKGIHVSIHEGVGGIIGKEAGLV